MPFQFYRRTCITYLLGELEASNLHVLTLRHVLLFKPSYSYVILSRQSSTPTIQVLKAFITTLSNVVLGISAIVIVAIFLFPRANVSLCLSF